MAENTFLGLQPYTEADAYRFKGRSEESQELFRLIIRNDYTVCYAESGEGKTSLLNAGVFPLLRQNMYFPIAITFTSDDYKRTPDSFDAVIDRCIKDSITDYNEKNKGINIEYRLCSTDFQNFDCQMELQQRLSKHSWWKLRNYKPQAMGLTFTPVFVFDQFEEVFNMPISIVWTNNFFKWLEDVSADSCPDKIVNVVREIIGFNAAFPGIKENKDFKAVFSLRKEFIGELDYWGMQKCFIPSLKDNRYCLKALTYEGAKTVMTQQKSFKVGKVEQVLRYFVELYSQELEHTIKENLPVIPALLLSVVCNSWEKSFRNFIDIDTSSVGLSLTKILEEFYDETIDAVVGELVCKAQKYTHPDDSSSNKAIGGFFRKDIDIAMLSLVDINGKRVRVKAVTTLGSMRVGEELRISKYKKILSKYRIIKISRIDNEDYVELVHDALCPVISKKKEIRLIEEVKEQEEFKLREKARKMRKRMMFIGAFFITAIVLITIFLWQKSKFLKELEARNLSEVATLSRNSVQLRKALEFLNLSEIQKDSLKKQKDAMALLYDSISQLNKSLLDKVVVIEQQKEDIENQYKLLVEQININSQQEMQLLTVNDAAIALGDAIALNDTLGIRKATNEIREHTGYFSSLRIVDDSNLEPSKIIYRQENNNMADSLISSMDKMLLSDFAENANIWGGQTFDSSILTKTGFVKGGQSIKYKFSSKGHQTIAVVAELGGFVTLKIHVTNRAGLDRRYDDTKDVKKGRRQRIVSFDLPTDIRNVVEVEVINCTQKDISFVVISN